MKKWMNIILLVCVGIISSSCSMTAKTPTNGLWYCEELNMEIDFFLYTNENYHCVKIYDENGSYDILRGITDHGGDFVIHSLEQYEYENLIDGRTKYHNNEFQIITSENGKREKYSFVWKGPSPYYYNPRNMLTKVYFEEQLAEIANYTGTMNELLSEYNAYRITKTDYGYRMSFKAESKITNVMYDDEGNKLYGNICGISRNILHFQQASVKTLENVQEVDPSGDYSFEWNGGGDSTRKSYHCTEDGEFIEITYATDNEIIDIYNEPL